MVAEFISERRNFRIFKSKKIANGAKVMVKNMKYNENSRKKVRNKIIF